MAPGNMLARILLIPIAYPDKVVEQLTEHTVGGRATGRSIRREASWAETQRTHIMTDADRRDAAFALAAGNSCELGILRMIHIE